MLDPPLLGDGSSVTGAFLLGPPPRSFPQRDVPAPSRGAAWERRKGGGVDDNDYDDDDDDFTKRFQL